MGPHVELDPGPEAAWLSVVLPVRDELGSLPRLLDELGAVLDGVEATSEIIVVDDASRDGSLEWLQVRAAGDVRLRVIALGGHRGQASALDAGFRAASGRVIAMLDADGQNDPRDLPRLLGLLDPETDVVCGVRAVRRDRWHRRAASRLANAVRNRLTGESVTDVGCSLRVMRASVVQRVKLERGLHRFLPTLLRLEGARIVETPVAHRPRAAGRSKYGVLDRLPEALRDLWRVRRLYLASRRRRPHPEPARLAR